MEETVILTSTQDTHGDLAPASTSRIRPVAPSSTAPATTTPIDLAATTPIDLPATTPIDLAATTPSEIAATTLIDLAITTHSDPHAMSPNDPAALSSSSAAPSPLIIPGRRGPLSPRSVQSHINTAAKQNTVEQNTGSVLAECSKSLAAIRRDRISS